MAGQAGNKNGDGGPKVKFNEVYWPGPVVIHGPTPNDVEDDDDKDNGEGPSNRLYNDTLPGLVIVPRTSPDTFLGDGNVQPVQKATPVDSLVSSDLDQLDRSSINEGRVRDSLELYHRRLSRSSSAVSPFTEVERKKPTPAIHSFNFCMPSTMHRPGRTSHALNVIQPYPNPCGLKRTRTAPVDLGRCTNPLLIRPPESITVTYMPTGTVIATKASIAQQPQNEEGKAAKAPRRFSPAGVVARLIGKDKTKDAGVAPEESSGGVLKRRKIKAKDKGKGKAVEFVDPNEPPASGSKDNPKAKGVGSAQAGNAAAQHSIMKGGQGQGQAGEVAGAGQSAPQEDDRAASDLLVGAGHRARVGKLQAVKVLKNIIPRKVRKVFGQHLKLPALFK